MLALSIVGWITFKAKGGQPALDLLTDQVKYAAIAA
jgi:hypothetical protein